MCHGCGAKIGGDIPENELLSTSDQDHPIASCWQCLVVVVGLIARNYGQLTIWRRGAHETAEEEGRLSRVHGKWGRWYCGMLRAGMEWWFCLRDLNRKSSQKDEGKIQPPHMASNSWKSLKHVHLMLMAWGAA